MIGIAGIPGKRTSLRAMRGERSGLNPRIRMFSRHNERSLRIFAECIRRRARYGSMPRRRAEPHIHPNPSDHRLSVSMTAPGAEHQPLRIAIVGAGPAAFYAADYITKQKDLHAEIDMFDRLPTPFGLVRGGVAPDHQSIKNVVRVYHKIAQRPGFRFFGNVCFGADVTVDDLRRHYHQIFYATGAQTDRALGIPGEDLYGSRSATEFVAWYNGHPDYRHLEFDLSVRSAAVIGVGNVAIDVARILCRTPEELAATDIADHALERLRESRIREVHILGRRGPVQAAFTPPEAKELGVLEGADAIVRPEEAALDPLSEDVLASAGRRVRRNVEIVQGFAERSPLGKPKRLHIRFLVSPTEIVGDDAGRVSALRIVHNELRQTDDGALRPRPTDRFETIPAGLIFRSVGYRGVPLQDVPFDEARHIIPNDRGRVIDPATGQPMPGEYAGGWIKRGPSGVIGTNKADSVETATCMLEDVRNGTLLRPETPTAEAAERMIRSHCPDYFSYEDWMRLDELEIARGQKAGRPRIKFTSAEAMRAALNGAAAA